MTEQATTDLQTGDKVLFRNGEICTIKEIRTNPSDITTCSTSFETVTFKANTLETIVLEFDDNEITIANRNEFTSLSIYQS